MSIIENDILNSSSENYDPLRAIKEGIVTHSETNIAQRVPHTSLGINNVCEECTPMNTICGAVYTNKFSCN